MKFHIYSTESIIYFTIMQQPQIIKPDKSVYTIHKFNTLDSTNTFIKDNYENLSDFSVVLAEKQTGGRGRFSRKWDSVPGKDLTFSIFLPLSRLKHDLWQNVTQVSSLAIIEVLENYGLSALIKWPNDILVENRKLCGILCETVERNLRTCAVIGVGINVNSASEDISHLDIPATSISIELKRSVNREDLLRKLLDKIILSFYELTDSGFTRVRLKIIKRLACLDEYKTVIDGTKKYYGQIKGISKSGTLLFECSNGKTVNINSGELSFNMNQSAVMQKDNSQKDQ